MYFKRKVYDKLLEWKSYIQKNMRYCWKAQDELASRLLRRPLQKMNIGLIF